MYKTNNKFEILTPSGFQNFKGMNCVEHKTALKIVFCDNSFIICSHEHPLIDVDGNIILGKDIIPTTHIMSVNTTKEVKHISLVDIKDKYYDPINVSNGNVYFSNGVVSHNCEFLSSEALLIDSQKLISYPDLSNTIVYEKDNVSYFGEIIPNETYIVGVDPATGSLRDFSVMEIFHFPSLVQVAEFRSNTMDSTVVYSILKKLFKIFEIKKCEVFFSVENNGVGEGILALFQNDDQVSELITLVSEEGGNRPGFSTTKNKKMKVCLEFKKLFESNQMKIKSPIVLKELKTFIKKAVNYEAQRGSTDDCISAILVIIRILNEMTTYDQRAFEKFFSYDNNETEDTNKEEFDDSYEPDPIVS